MYVAMHDKHMHKKLYSNFLAIHKIGHNAKAILQGIKIKEKVHMNKRKSVVRYSLVKYYSTITTACIIEKFQGQQDLEIAVYLHSVTNWIISIIHQEFQISSCNVIHKLHCFTVNDIIISTSGLATLIYVKTFPCTLISHPLNKQHFTKQVIWISTNN